jgi:hypothetical protein
LTLSRQPVLMILTHRWLEQTPDVMERSVWFLPTFYYTLHIT